MDFGLMFTWLPKLFILGLGAALIVRLLVIDRRVAWTFGAILPISYEVVRAIWETGIPTSANPGFWFLDLPVICAVGLFATVPGALIGSFAGGRLRRLAAVR